jgi:hypothetical protein
MYTSIHSYLPTVAFACKYNDVVVVVDDDDDDGGDNSETNTYSRRW